MDIFTKQEMEAFENITPETIDIDKLKELGEVTIVEGEEDGIITTTIDFKSYDGISNFTKVHRYYAHNKEYQQVKELNARIQLAVSKEDYEKASELTNKKQSLLNNPA